jgi:arsenate reductase
VEVEFKDIVREPPSRAFLERHVVSGRETEFLGMRSPVLKGRPMPTSRREAIDLMLDQPNVIKRPVLVAGDTVLFGFDQERYRRLFT